VSGSAAIACALLLSCSAGTSQAHIDSLEPAAPVQFSFRRQDGVEFSSQNSRGRATMVALVTTYDLGSQLLLRRVEEALRAHRPRANAGAIVMEPPKYEVLLDTYAEAMNLSFPMVLSDLATREGRGPFGDVDYLPVLIVLDADGRPVARYEGPVDLQVLLDALAEASPPGRGEL
jgi:hypothetical protein